MQNNGGRGGGMWRSGRREKMEVDEALEAALPGPSRLRPRPGMALQSMAKANICVVNYVDSELTPRLFKFVQ